MLSIQNLHIAIDDKPIVNGISLSINPGEVHAIMGPNGSGKSTLAMALAGHPRYTLTSGTVALNGAEIHALPAHERARAGLFLSFQHPMEIPGVSVLNFLRAAATAVRSQQQEASSKKLIAHPGLERRLPEFVAFKKMITDRAQSLGLSAEVVDRGLNEGFSGGEKKKLEMVQASMLDPKYVILDEIDSGLDVDALRVVGQAAQKMQEAGKGIIVITHYARLLHHLPPTHVHVMVGGKIVCSGGAEIAADVERDGYSDVSHGIKNN